MATKTYTKRISLDFKVEANDQKEATAEIADLLAQVRRELPTGVSVSITGRTQLA